MAFTQISGTIPQYFKETINGGAGPSSPASGYYIKFYNSSNAPISMASDKDGGGLLAKARLDSSGYPLNGSGNRFIPFIDQLYKIAFYKNADDADNNNTTSVDWFLGPYPPFLNTETDILSDLNNGEGIAFFDATVTYPENGLVTGSDGIVYQALSQNINDDPVTSSSGAWEEFTPNSARRKANITVTVGPTAADYITINDAINFLQLKRPNQQAPLISGTINLLTGFLMSEQIITNSVDLSWITIISVDAVVNVQRSAMTTALFGQFPLFGADKTGRTPTINCNFSIDTSGTAANRSFVYCDHGGGATVLSGAGCVGAFDGLFALGAGSHINASGAVVESSLQNNVFAVNSAVIDAFGGQFSNAIQYNIYSTRASIINCRESTAINAGSHNIFAAHSSLIAANFCTATGAGDNGVYAFDGSNIAAEFTDVSNAGGSGFFAVHGSKISALDGIANACTDNGAYAFQGSTVAAQGLIAVGCDTGARAVIGSNLTANGSTADLSGSLSYGVYCEDSSSVDCRSANLSGAGNRGVQANHNASVDARETNCSGATSRGVSAFGASTINAESANCSGAGSNGVNADRGSIINATNTNAQVGGSPGSGDIRCATGSQITAHGATGGTSKTVNLIDSDGIIYS